MRAAERGRSPSAQPSERNFLQYRKSFLYRFGDASSFSSPLGNTDLTKANCGAGDHNDLHTATGFTLWRLPGVVTQAIDQCDCVTLVITLGDILSDVVVSSHRNWRISFPGVKRSTAELRHLQRIVGNPGDNVRHNGTDNGSAVNSRHGDEAVCTKRGFEVLSKGRRPLRENIKTCRYKTQPSFG